MMDLMSLKLQKRDTTGKGAAKRLRLKELIPAVCYGNGNETVSCTCSPKDVLQILNGEQGRNTVFKADLEGSAMASLAIIRAIQVHPLKRKLLHVDILFVDEKKPIVAKVPVEVSGRSEGEKLGGRLILCHREMEVEATPFKIPKQIVIEVTNLGSGSRLLIGDVPIPEGVTARYRSNYAMVTVSAPGAAEEEEEVKVAEGEEKEGEKAEEEEKEE
jgi:large subunit ribosomal protein L25